MPQKIISLSAVCESLNGPDAIKLKQTSLSGLGEGEVIVTVKAAALNFPDLLMTYGKYQFKPELPFVVGMEGAGEIAAVGPNVCRFQIGDRVIFKGKTGACCTHIRVSEEMLTRLPENLTFEEGAAFGVTFQTAYISLAKRGKLQAGDVLLVHGAGGGVGQAAVSVGKALGATVIATASSSEKLEIARQSGADYLINYQTNSFAEEVMRMTGGHGVNVILDPVGGDVLEESVDCLAWEGRLLTVGFASGSFGNVPLDKLRLKGGALIGVRAGEFGRRKPGAGAQASTELLELARQKNLRPWIGRVWGVEQTVDALCAMEKREVLGKQVIRMSGERSPSAAISS